MAITEPPFSEEDYLKAQDQGLDLNNWNDYVKFYKLGDELLGYPWRQDD